MKITIPSVKIGDINYYVQSYFSSSEKIPRRYIINKNATILFWNDNTKTIVKRSKEDEHNPRLAFLTAYFQKHSGLSKNKANKYLNSLIEEEQVD